MITGVHIRNNGNVGDASCCPIDYFDFGFAKKQALDFSQLKEDHKKDFVIIGGGGLFHKADENASISYFDTMLSYGKKKVFWGVGQNIHGKIHEDYPHDQFKKLDLVGIRDLNSGYIYVPCVSCMSPLFDLNHVISHKYVIFEHGGVKIGEIRDKIPKLKATECNMKEAIFHLASGQIVFTNSYHGAYWSLLLGKKVVVINPFSSRFHHIHPYLVFADEKTAIEKADKAKADVSYLEWCRKHNRSFYQSVMELYYKEYMNEA